MNTVESKPVPVDRDLPEDERAIQVYAIRQHMTAGGLDTLDLSQRLINHCVYSRPPIVNIEQLKKVASNPYKMRKMGAGKRAELLACLRKVGHSGK